MWYVLVFLGIALMVVSYRAKKACRRNPAAVSLYLRLLGNDAATILCACLVLFFIFLLVFFSDPAPLKSKNRAYARELMYQRAMGEQLARTLKAQIGNGDMAIVIEKKVSAIQGKRKDFQQARLEGLRTGFGKGVKLIEIQVGPNPDEEISITNEKEKANPLILTQDKLDRVVLKYPSADYLVSFVGVPPGYDQTNAAFKTSNQQMACGFFTDNIYLLGYLIASKHITACIVPRRRFSYLRENQAKPSDSLEKKFADRYILVTPKTVAAFAKKNRLMIKVNRVL